MFQRQISGVQLLLLATIVLLWGVGCDDVVYESHYHSPGWEQAGVHGLAAKLQEDTCDSCHGSALTGVGEAPGCDDCHLEAYQERCAPDCDTGWSWTSDCTFCHGGDDGDTNGAPPHDIDGQQLEMSFLAHRAHTETNLHAAYACTECHATPEDAFTAGHFLIGDDTPGVAEVDQSEGLSSAATWDGNGTCSDSYCHGDGIALGEVVHDASLSDGCDGCHADTTAEAWLTEAPAERSGRHYRHLSAGLVCADCHGAVVDTGDAVVDPSLHVDGAVSFDADVELEVSAELTCEGSCHDAEHDAFEWSSDAYHPAYGTSSFAEAVQDTDNAELVHGMQAKLLTQTCTDCHGSELAGEGDAVSCGSCHDPDGDGTVDDEDEDEDWRSHCSYCHGDGGTADEESWGAPPQDADGETTDLSFLAHQAHVLGQAEDAERLTDGFSCSMCHLQPVDLFSSGHFFIGDDTPGEAEVQFDTGLLGESTLSDAAYLGEGGCSNIYCHGYGLGAHEEGTYGDVVHTDDFTDGDTGTAARCDDCHPSVHSERAAFEAMSGRHRAHLWSEEHHHPPASGCEVPEVEITCTSCHAETSGEDGTTIIGAELHVDGDVSVSLDEAHLPDGSGLTPMTWDAASGSCTGVCHCEDHTRGENARLWESGGP